MKFTAKEIAKVLKGSVEGETDVELKILSKIEEADSGSLTFLANPKYTSFIYETSASAVVVGKDFIPEQDLSVTLIRVDDPYNAFTQLLELYKSNNDSVKGIKSTAIIHSSSNLGANCYVGDYSIIEEHVTLDDSVKIHSQCFIGSNVSIGKGTTIHTGVKIKSDTIIGENCEIHSGSVIGSDGFGFSPQADGTFKKVPQTGNVVIKDHVSIGANTTIDRATLGSTIIGEGVKLDNLIQIAHNVEIGAHTVIASQTGIAGSTKIGKHCVIGGQVGIVGHITIGDYVQIQAQSGVSRSLDNKMKIQGTPALDYTTFMKSYIHFKNLPKIEKRLSQIEKSTKK